VGSIVGNVLLVLGGAMLAGGRGRERQSSDRTAVQATPACSCSRWRCCCCPRCCSWRAAPAFPSIGDPGVDLGADVKTLSIAMAAVLLGSYVTAMVFALHTHPQVFNPPTDGSEDQRHGGEDSTRGAMIRLAVAGVLVAVTSEFMVDSMEQTASLLGVSTFFLGIVVMAIVGNAAEHWVAILADARDQMHLAMTIAFGSGSQIALVVTPDYRASAIGSWQR
jgi:Ca2+:H+ antiporter